MPVRDCLAGADRLPACLRGGEDRAIWSPKFAAQEDIGAVHAEHLAPRGAFNWYRAMDLSWEDARALPDQHIHVPAMMITAENDMILRPEAAAPMRGWIDDLRIEHIKRCAHWTQQEKPDEVNALLLDYLGYLRK